MITQLSRRRDMLIKSQSFHTFKNSVNINIKSFPEGESWHTLFEEKHRFLALIKKYQNQDQGLLHKGKE